VTAAVAALERTLHAAAEDAPPDLHGLQPARCATSAADPPPPRVVGCKLCRCVRRPTNRVWVKRQSGAVSRLNERRSVTHGSSVCVCYAACTLNFQLAFPVGGGLFLTTTDWKSKLGFRMDR